MRYVIFLFLIICSILLPICLLYKYYKNKEKIATIFKFTEEINSIYYILLFLRNLTIQLILILSFMFLGLLIILSLFPIKWAFGSMPTDFEILITDIIYSIIPVISTYIAILDLKRFYIKKAKLKYFILSLMLPILGYECWILNELFHELYLYRKYQIIFYISFLFILLVVYKSFYKKLLKTSTN